MIIYHPQAIETVTKGLSFLPLTRNHSDMAPASTTNTNLKDMSELSMLTLLIPAAAAIKNRNGDTTIHGYVESQEITARRVITPAEEEVKFAILDSIGDVLLQSNQILAISPDEQKQEQEQCSVSILIQADSDMEHPPEHPISKVSSICANVVPNPDDRFGTMDSSHPPGPLGNIRQTGNGTSMWEKIKKDPLHYAAR